MHNIVFLILILVVLAIVSIRDGYLNTVDPDAVWSRVASRLRRRGLTAERTQEWDDAAPQRALVNYVVGGFAVAALVYLLIVGQAIAPAPPQYNATINGRPATPEETQELLYSIQRQNSTTRQ